jgi:hypothetical protein
LPNPQNPKTCVIDLGIRATHRPPCKVTSAPPASATAACSSRCRDDFVHASALRHVRRYRLWCIVVDLCRDRAINPDPPRPHQFHALERPSSPESLRRRSSRLYLDGSEVAPSEQSPRERATGRSLFPMLTTTIGGPRTRRYSGYSLARWIPPLPANLSAAKLPRKYGSPSMPCLAPRVALMCVTYDANFRLFGRRRI